jgi:hypothetical protein
MDAERTPLSLYALAKSLGFEVVPPPALMRCDDPRGPEYGYYEIDLPTAGRPKDLAVLVRKYTCSGLRDYAFRIGDYVQFRRWAADTL